MANYSPKPHPHTGAVYRLLTLDDGFGVEMVVEGAQPATVKPFATESDAQAWIAKHKGIVDAGESVGGRRGPRNKAFAR